MCRASLPLAVKQCRSATTGQPEPVVSGVRILQPDSLRSKNAHREAVMLYKLGRALQVAGMIILPVGMAGNIVRPEQITVQDSLVIAGAAVAVFGLGWLLQQVGRPR